MKGKHGNKKQIQNTGKWNKTLAWTDAHFCSMQLKASRVKENKNEITLKLDF